MKSVSDRAFGIRYYLLLIPLFAAVLLSAFALSYSGQIDAELQSLHQISPLANPTLILSQEGGGKLNLDSAALDGLSEIGDCTSVICYDTETADGIRIRLLAMDTDAHSAFVLTEGRMPQNETECVLVSLTNVPASDITNTSAVYGVQIGSAIRPCDENGDVLIPQNGVVPCMLTVVGIGENILSALSPITQNDTDILVYTVSDEAWNTSSTDDLLYLTDCTVDDPPAAVQAIYTAAKDRYLNRLASSLIAEEQTPHLAAAEAADRAVLAQEISIQSIENRLGTAELRVTEVETLMMDAVAALQAEQQDFVSDMEYNEYYALRQVDLIPRRDRAEEGYAKQEEVIAQYEETLRTAYADRDIIRAELQHAQDVLVSLQQTADEAHVALDLALSAARNTDFGTWKLTSQDRMSGLLALQAHAALHRKTALICGAAAAMLFFVGSITVYLSSRKSADFNRGFVGIYVLTVIPALLFGGSVMPIACFARSYPMLNGSMTLSFFSGTALSAQGVILIASVVLIVVIALIGRRNPRRAENVAQK